MPHSAFIKVGWAGAGLGWMEYDEDDEKLTPKNDFYKKAQNVAIVKKTDMPEEMKQETVETITSAIEVSLEKHPQNYEFASKNVKEQMDKKYGKAWHCIVGEGFGFSVTYEVRHLIYLFFGGNLAVLVFKGRED